MLGVVVAVLGAAVALGNPDGLVVFEERLLDVGGERVGVLQLLAHGARPLHLDHLVQLRDFVQQRGGVEVVAHRDTGGSAVFHEEVVLQQRGVERDVAVVADEHVGHALVDVLDARQRHPFGRLGDEDVHEPLVQVALHILDSVKIR